MEAPFDVIIIGGGPGGSTAGTVLASAGHRVLLLEKDRFPRFHIGESLLPYNRRLFDEIGVLPKLEAAGFMQKYGAQFHSGNGAHAVKFVFRNGRFTREHQAIQVERAAFDHLLLNHARERGVDAREGWTVRRFNPSATHITVEARAPDGQPASFRASFLIDASGRGNVTGNQDQLRVIHPKLKKLAVFGHFSGVRLDDGPTGGDTVIVRLADKWFWLIPLSREKVSVGCVLNQEEFTQAGLSPADLFDRTWRSSVVMRQRLEDAQLLGPIQTTSDFSYHNRRFVGHRLVRVGDAAGFMDPIFSAGVYLAMSSAQQAARAIQTALDANNDGTTQLADYERRLRLALSTYWPMVEYFYTTPFMELFFSPQEHFHLASAVNAILAGELNGGWALRWRMRLFFLLIRLQRRFPIVPRASFD
jgi:flavin-dependent dehydrogenase